MLEEVGGALMNVTVRKPRLGEKYCLRGVTEVFRVRDA